VSWETARQDPAYGTAAWKRARAACLKRAEHRCELGLDGCQGTATEADHVLGLAADPGHTNLRAVCRSCHLKRTAEQANTSGRRRRRREPSFVPRTQW
jgi:5-methylcytosine-specific restriction endonuclease McrA